jgi:hypothetical protein
MNDYAWIGAEEESEIKGRVDELESKMFRATLNRQGQLKKYVDNIHDKFNARVNDRLENKQ